MPRGTAGVRGQRLLQSRRGRRASLSVPRACERPSIPSLAPSELHAGPAEPDDGREPRHTGIGCVQLLDLLTDALVHIRIRIEVDPGNLEPDEVVALEVVVIVV